MGWVQRQDVDCRREPDVLRLRNDARQQDVRAGIDAEAVEVVFADPSRTVSQLVRQNGLLAYLEDEVARTTWIVRIVVIGKREIAEIYCHGVFP